MKKGILLAAFTVCFFLVFGQIGGKGPETRIDTTFIKSYYNDLIIRVYSADKGNNFLIRDRSNDLNIRFRPNNYYKVGVGVNYKWFGLKIGANLPATNANESVYGKSSSFGLQSYIVARRFMLDVVALNSKSYYLQLSGKNARDFVSSDDEVYDVQSGLQSTNIGVNFIYVLNYKRFSYKAAFNQTDLQKRSAGSVILGVGASSYEIKGNEKLISDEINSNYFKEWGGLDAIRSYTLYSGFGYAYSLVPFQKTILTGAVVGRLGVRYNQMDFEGSKEKLQTRPGMGAEFRLSGGYHLPWFYLGASFVQAQFNSDVKFNTLQFSNGTSFLEVTISKRIKL